MMIRWGHTWSFNPHGVWARRSPWCFRLHVWCKVGPISPRGLVVGVQDNCVWCSLYRALMGNPLMGLLPLQHRGAIWWCNLRCWSQSIDSDTVGWKWLGALTWVPTTWPALEMFPLPEPVLWLDWPLWILQLQDARQQQPSGNFMETGLVTDSRGYLDQLSRATKTLLHW